MKKKTEEGIRELSGRKLDAAVQEEIFGDRVEWHWCFNENQGYGNYRWVVRDNEYYDRGKDEAWESLPCYWNDQDILEPVPAHHSDGNAMLALMERLEKYYSVKTLCPQGEDIYYIYIWVAGDTRSIQASDKSLPTALCRAALLAILWGRGKKSDIY